MFTKELLESDRHAIGVFSRMLTYDPYKVGRLKDTHTIASLIDKVTKTHFEEVKYLPKYDLHLIRTNDLGFGYSSYMSPNRLHELIEFGKIPKDIPIDFEYKHGNVFTSIELDIIDSDLLLTDDIYFVIKKATSQIWHSVIGRPTSPNLLYFRDELSGFKSTLDKAKTIQNFNRIEFVEKIIADFI